MSNEKLIVALDVRTPDEACEIVSELRDIAVAFKVGLRLATAAGTGIVKKLVDDGLKVFLDLKFHDIPNTVAQSSVEAARLGVWMLNIHASGGGEMMRRTVEEVGEACEKENLARPLIIGVTALTSSDDATLAEIGVSDNVNEHVLRLAKLCRGNGLDGVVASPLECSALRAAGLNSDFVIVTPGIRHERGTKDDQKRVMSAGAAVAAGADYIVVGRPITGARDRRAATTAVLGEL